MSILDDIGLGGLVDDAVEMGTNATVDIVVIVETPGTFGAAAVRTETKIEAVPVAVSNWTAATISNDSTPATGFEFFVAAAKFGVLIPKNRLCRVEYNGESYLVEKVMPLPGGLSVAGYTLICEG